MSQLLITGIPGHGKTLMALVEADKLEKQGRKVYAANVRGLKRDWPSFDPLKWMDLPDGSVLLVDEAQEFWRQRSPRDPLPPSVLAMEKHRHRGFSFILTCQHPKQLDFELRRYVDRHVHLRRSFNLANSVALEQPREFDPDDKSDLRKCLKTSFKFPKEVYGWYESATEHNMKARLPARVLAFPVLVIGFLALAYYGYKTVSGFGDSLKALPGGAPVVAGGKPVVSGSLSQAPMPSSGKERDVSSAAAYQPRIGWMLHSAARYDDVTKPVRAPVPAACISMASKGCKCFTQQGTPYAAPEDVCKTIVANGYFVDFEPEGGSREGVFSARGSGGLRSGRDGPSTAVEVPAGPPGLLLIDGGSAAGKSTSTAVVPSPSPSVQPRVRPGSPWSFETGGQG